MHQHANPGHNPAPSGDLSPSAEALEQHDLLDVLACVMTTPHDAAPVSHAHVRNLCATTRAAGTRIRAWRLRDAGRLAGAVAAMLLPGRVAIVLLPGSPRMAAALRGQRETLATAVAALAGERLHYVQALLEPVDAFNQALLAAAGFRKTTTLQYLDRPVSDDIPSEVAAPAIAWATYAPARHEEFGATLLATYEDSLDCPELAGLRPIEDVIASHRATGEFDPDLWQLARVGGRSVGCLLLGRSASAEVAEVVYMGVVPAVRRRGWGGRLLARAFTLARVRGVERLALAVDERNAPARALYARHGFVRCAARVVWLRR